MATNPINIYITYLLTNNKCKYRFTCSCAAGRLTSATISVHGCSTWRRGFSSRKWNVSSSSLYRYSNVPVLTYPTMRASCTADCHTHTHTHTHMAVWCSGNALVSINAVALHRAWLVLGWVTAFGQVNCLIM